MCYPAVETPVVFVSSQLCGKAWDIIHWPLELHYLMHELETWSNRKGMGLGDWMWRKGNLCCSEQVA